MRKLIKRNIFFSLDPFTVTETLVSESNYLLILKMLNSKYSFSSPTC